MADVKPDGPFGGNAIQMDSTANIIVGENVIGGATNANMGDGGEDVTLAPDFQLVEGKTSYKLAELG